MSIPIRIDDELDETAKARAKAEMRSIPRMAFVSVAVVFK